MTLTRDSADDASYQYCIMGRQVVRFEVMAFEKPTVSMSHWILCPDADILIQG